MDIKRLNQHISEGLVQVNKHLILDLYIYNYTPKVQFERIWDEVTLQCRGLILNGDGEIVARPFAKFFNLGELEGQTLPALPFEVYEKMDGSLGISYCYNGEIYIATRGSFNSDQAQKANTLLRSRYTAAMSQMQAGITYLFEIIYPENRIVVNYGAEESLTLLAMIDTATGKELPLHDIGFPMVKKYDGLNDLTQLSQLEEANREGFVVKFANDFRLKIKFAEYVRIHRLVTQISSISIWENLMTGADFEAFIADIPDEFYQWVKMKKAALELEFRQIEDLAKAEFKILGSRKETAQYFMTCRYPKILFKMLDQRPYDELIWRLIRPRYERPFSE